MAIKKKSTTNDEEVFQMNEIENSPEMDQKIELVSSTDPNINVNTNNLQSEIDLFESDLNESLNTVDSEIIDPNPRETIEPEKIELLESEERATAEPTKNEVNQPEHNEITEPKSEVEQEIEIIKAEEPETKPKKKSSKKTKEKAPKKTKSKKTEEKENKDPAIQEEKESVVQEVNESKKAKPKSNRKSKKKEVKPEAETSPNTEAENKDVKEPEKVHEKVSNEPVKLVETKKEVKEELVDITSVTNAIADPKIQATVLSLYNENAELKENIEKAKKIIRILKRKLELSEEKEEQWRACAHSIGDIFAEKSNMSLEEVLKRFEAPLDEIEVSFHESNFFACL